MDKINIKSDKSNRLFYVGMIAMLGVLPSYLGSTLPVFRDTLQFFYGINLTQLSILFTLGAIPGAAGTLIAGIMLDRIGPLPLLRVGLFGSAAGMAIGAFSRSFETMLIAVLLVSMFSAILLLVIPAYLMRLFPNHHRRALTLFLAVFGLVSMIYPLMAELIMHVHQGHPSIDFGFMLRIPLAVLSIVILCGGVWILRAKYAEPPSPDADAVPMNPCYLLRGMSYSSIGLIALLVLHGTSDTLLVIWLPRIMDSASFHGRGLPPGIIISGAALAYLVSRTLLGMVPEHRGRRFGMAAPGLLGGTVILIGILSQNKLAFGVCYMLGALLWSCGYPVILSRAAKEDPRRFGAIMALSSIVASISIFLLGMSIGSVGQVLGEERLWMLLLVPACGFLMVGFGSIFWLLLRKHAISRSIRLKHDTPLTCKQAYCSGDA